MSEQHQGGIRLVNEGAIPWWIRLCRWLWKHPLPFIGSTLIINVAINIGSTWLIASTNTNAIPDTSMFGRTVTWIGAHWLFSCLLLTISSALLLVTWLGNRWPTSTSSAHGQIQMSVQDRERVLQRLRLRYKEKLSQSLEGEALIELGLREKTAAIHNAASLSLRLPEQPEGTLPSGCSIVNVYSSAGQELLILGEPGAGKTTLLLELACHLVEQAKSDETHLLPVLLPLSSWATNHRSLQDWLIEQVALLCDAPWDLSKQWVQADWVLPLLDGLNEMDVSDRPACIRAINTYRREHLRPLVVCCRTNEYEAVSPPERLTLPSVVVVQPLSQEQVDAYLACQGERLAPLRGALKEKPTLAELTTTPLMLQILIRTYHKITVRQRSCTQAAFLQQLWTEYVQRMVESKGNATHYPLDRTVICLGWLARQMRDRNQAIFSPEKTEPYWLTKRQRRWYRWSVGILVGMVGGLLSGLLFGLLSGLIGGLITMLFIGLGGKIVKITTQEPERPAKAASERQPSEQRVRSVLGINWGTEELTSKWVQVEKIAVQLDMPWSWRKELGGALALLIAILTLFGGVGLFSWMYPKSMLLAEQFAKQVFQAASFLPSVPILLIQAVLPIPSELLLCMYSSLFSLMIVPLFLALPFDQGVGIDQSRPIGHTVLGLLLGLLEIGGLIVLLSWHWKTFDTLNIFAVILSLLLLTQWWLPSLLLFSLFLGRGPMLLHYVLRFWLWRNGLVPWDWKPVSFLEDATARCLLQRVGEGYSFHHQLLHEYFADLNTVIPSSLTSVHPAQQHLQP